MALSKWWHRLLEFSPVGGMGWSAGRTEVLGGQMAEAFNRYGDGNDCKIYLVSWLPLTALKGVQKKMRN